MGSVPESTKLCPCLSGTIVLAISPADPRVVLAGVERFSVYRCTDQGDDWTAANEGLYRGHVDALAVSPADSQMVLLAADGDVFRSADKGRSWKPICEVANSAMWGMWYSDDDWAAALAIDPIDPRVVYLGTENFGVVAIDPHGSLSIYPLIVDYGMLGIEPIYAPVSALAIAPTDPRVILAGTEGYGLFRTTSDGSEWCIGLPNASVKEVVRRRG